MPHRARLLGFAFANADFLFEVDDKGTIQFAAGAATDLVPGDSGALVGTPVGKLFEPSEGAKFATFAKALKSGERAGPFKLTLCGGKDAQIAMFRLPANGKAISCTLSKPGRPAFAPADGTGLNTRNSFLAAAAGMAGADDALTLVDVPGLPDLCAQLSPPNAEAMLARIGKSIADSGARASGRLSDTRFAAIASALEGPLGLAALVRDAIVEGGLTAPRIAETAISLQGPGLSPEQRILALRYVVEKFAEDGRLESNDGDIASVFAGLMQETQKRLLDMTKIVGEGAFELAYQPIADLGTGKVSHYEALARFSNKQGTGDTVKFIEALGIANAFDLAVMTKVLSVLEQDTRTHFQVAFNLSGRTLAVPASFGMVAAILAKKRKLAPRLLIEITETAEIGDLKAAAGAVAALRAMGYRVGLDDFGAGAASINYLHAFQVDFVKFDGALVQKIGTSQRDDALLSGMAKLCAEMGVTTIAEWIENDAMAKAARALGFHHGQGAHLGAPMLEIPDAVVAPGKRKGAKESWG